MWVSRALSVCGGPGMTGKGLKLVKRALGGCGASQTDLTHPRPSIPIPDVPNQP